MSYQLLHPVWHDRFGTTHIGRGVDGQPAAVRVLSARDPAVLRRAATERNRLTGVRHPNIAAVRDVLVDDVVTIAADAVLGVPLLRREGTLTPAEFHRLSADLTAALDTLHAHGVTHRTLNARNVVIDQAGRVVLTDIGVGHLVCEPGTVRTDQRALETLLQGLWRGTHRLRRPPVWADTMAGAPNMG